MHRRSLHDLLAIDSTMDFHTYALEHVVSRYAAFCAARGAADDFGTVLAIGANRREARIFAGHPFSQIQLTGVMDPDEDLCTLVDSDGRIHYERQNTERLSHASAYVDLVFCKESLQHLARPLLGLYEMLRVCRTAAIFVEPWDTGLDRVFSRLGWSTVYESDQAGNLARRDNYVFRWNRRGLEALLRSLYLESGWELELTLGWR